MGLIRRALLKASQSSWLGERARRYAFVQRTAARFMPGETMDAALEAAAELAKSRIASLLTYLGENVEERGEAEAVTREYIELLGRIHAAGLPTEVSVKLTQLGVDLDEKFCYENLERLIETASVAGPRGQKTLWVDMERSAYVDLTLELHRRARERHRNTGVCVQAYLYRTEQDLESLIEMGAAVRLVKGAYNEPAEIAFPRKADVDENYFQLAQMLLGAEARRAGVRAAFATHDRKLIARIAAWAAAQGIEKGCVEFEMLYGIGREEQLRLAREGYRSGVLVSYGPSWFPWFTRRLAERPANLLFLARNFLPG